jgi:chlorite dismutase
METLQWAFREIRRARLIRALIPSWSAAGVHRDAEFNRSHVPGFLRGEEPRDWLCVYPFVRSYEWYLLPPEATTSGSSRSSRTSSSTWST